MLKFCAISILWLRGDREAFRVARAPAAMLASQVANRVVGCRRSETQVRGLMRQRIDRGTIFHVTEWAAQPRYDEHVTRKRVTGTRHAATEVANVARSCLLEISSGPRNLPEQGTVNIACLATLVALR